MLKKHHSRFYFYINKHSITNDDKQFIPTFQEERQVKVSRRGDHQSHVS
jgi:hypothetical protein